MGVEVVFYTLIRYIMSCIFPIRRSCFAESSYYQILGDSIRLLMVNVEDRCNFHSCLERSDCLSVIPVVEAGSECYLFTDRKIAKGRFEDVNEMFDREMED